MSLFRPAASASCTVIQMRMICFPKTARYNSFSSLAAVAVLGYQALREIRHRPGGLTRPRFNDSRSPQAPIQKVSPSHFPPFRSSNWRVPADAHQKRAKGMSATLTHQDIPHDQELLWPPNLTPTPQLLHVGCDDECHSNNASTLSPESNEANHAFSSEEDMLGLWEGRLLGGRSGRCVDFFAVISQDFCLVLHFALFL
jgi:hypothetical protein